MVARQGGLNFLLLEQKLLIPSWESYFRCRHCGGERAMSQSSEYLEL